MRRTTLLDRIGIAIVIFYALVWLAGALGGPIPYSSFLFFLAVLAVFYFVIRLLPWFRTQMLWRLRNRLIVAYVFIAVVPVVLLLAMAGLSAYVLYLQLGAHLLHDDLEDRISAIAADTDVIAGAMEQKDTNAPPGGDEALLSRPVVASLVEATRRDWPGARVLPNRGRHLVEAGRGEQFADLVEFEDNLWIASAVHRNGPFGGITVLVVVPLTPSILDSLSSELGPIQITLLRPVSQRPDSQFSLDIHGRVFVPSEQISSRKRTLAAPTSPLDVRVTGYSTLELVHVEPGHEGAPGAILASFSLRPSALNKRLFTSLGGLGPLLVNVLVVAGIVFLALELAAFMTGIALTRTITRSVGDLYDATLHVRRGDFGHRVRVQTRDQLGALGESFNDMTGSISELIEEQRKSQRLENEISIAREVQEQLFPRSLPSLPGIELAAICRPARTVSGDYYDFIPLGSSRVGIALADISGKGISAALLMASLQAALRSQVMLDGTGGTGELVARLNQHLFRNTSDDRYATLFYAVYDTTAKTLTYTNAGHLAPFLVMDGRVQQLDEGGTVVGLIEDCSYTQGTAKVSPGGILVAFSDGLTEPENVYGEEFGMQRLRDEILRRANASPQRLAESLVAAAEQWAGTAEQADDITVIVAHMS
jgi:phosphoserine phosphatase RsbU/P